MLTDQYASHCYLFSLLIFPPPSAEQAFSDSLMLFNCLAGLRPTSSISIQILQGRNYHQVEGRRMYKIEV